MTKYAIYFKVNHSQTRTPWILFAVANSARKATKMNNDFAAFHREEFEKECRRTTWFNPSYGFTWGYSYQVREIKK